MKLSVREMVLVSMFAALACAGGLMLRFGGNGVVPYSVLPFIVFLAGMLLGGRLAAVSITMYVVIGLVGIPVFGSAPFGGLAYFIKPTAGFLFGFIGAAFITGTIVERYRITGFVGYFIASLTGIIVIYLIGLPYLYVILNVLIGKAVNVAGVLQMSFFPFIGFDIIKAVIASLIAVPVSRQVKTFIKY